MGPSQISSGLNLTIGLTKEATVSERNGDKARFGRERRRKILRRKLTREVRKALETKQTSPTNAESER